MNAGDTPYYYLFGAVAKWPCHKEEEAYLKVFAWFDRMCQEGREKLKEYKKNLWEDIFIEFIQILKRDIYPYVLSWQNTSLSYDVNIFGANWPI